MHLGGSAVVAVALSFPSGSISAVAQPFENITPKLTPGIPFIVPRYLPAGWSFITRDDCLKLARRRHDLAGTRLADLTLRRRETINPRRALCGAT